MDRLTHVYDCTGSLIFFGQYILDCQNNSIKLSNDHYLQAVEVITAPTLIFELKRATRYDIIIEQLVCTNLYYLA
jgi:hypothetical protein